jgi:hypothetical protein
MDTAPRLSRNQAALEGPKSDRPNQIGHLVINIGLEDAELGSAGPSWQKADQYHRERSSAERHRRSGWRRQPQRPGAQPKDGSENNSGRRHRHHGDPRPDTPQIESGPPDRKQGEADRRRDHESNPKSPLRQQQAQRPSDGRARRKQDNNHGDVVHEICGPVIRAKVIPKPQLRALPRKEAIW